MAKAEETDLSDETKSTDMAILQVIGDDQQTLERLDHVTFQIVAGPAHPEYPTIFGHVTLDYESIKHIRDTLTHWLNSGTE